MGTEPDQPVIKKNWFKRILAATILFTCLLVVTYIGIPTIWFSTLLIQIKCFEEIISIAYNFKKLPEIPLFRTLNWYFLFVANYFFFGETFEPYLEVLKSKYFLLGLYFKYHRFSSFCLYIIALIWFINLLRRKVIRRQFSLLAWVHFLCIIIVMQSYMIIQNLFEGLIWVILPLMLVAFNDIFAYIFGKIYGKTPLIEVSPSKTLEGYCGGGLGAFLLGYFFAWLFCHVDHLVCPTKILIGNNSMVMSTSCTRNALFQPEIYDFYIFSINYYPFLFHVLILTLFASLIAPFGGFCASGFKRAFKTKDFGNFIPGHGGVMDRFDCQYLMATFVNVYIASFIRNISVEKIFARVLYLDDVGQLEFYHSLEKNLKVQGLLRN